MFKNAKSGDKVWDFSRGWGTVTSITSTSINVNFASLGTFNYYFDGRLYSSDLNPTLFWNELKFKVPEKPYKTAYVEGWAVFTTLNNGLTFHHLSPQEPGAVYENQLSIPIKGFLKLIDKEDYNE